MEQPWKLQWWWYLILLLMLVGGVALIQENWQVPQQIQQLSPSVRPDSWSRLLGIYLVSIVITHLVSFYAARGMGLLLVLKGPDKLADVWSPTLVGISESIMYPTAILIGKAEFIAVWLAVKVAGQWVRWAGEGRNDAEANEGRRRFNRFLVGNALIILAAFVTYGALRIWVLKSR
jgi:hypothetical protein